MTLPPPAFAANRFIGAVLLAAALGLPAHAVIVGGVNGSGSNNTGAATLNAQLALEGKPSFPYWNNVVRFSDATGIYLGYNPNTNRGWVLSANHIGEPTSVTVAGNSYAIIDPQPLDAGQNGYRITTPVLTDLTLYELDFGMSVPPTLSAAPILSAPAALGDYLIMAGRGRRADTGIGATAPYAWSATSFSDAVTPRWGTNIVDGIGLTDINGAVYLGTDFDAPGAPLGDNGTTFDGQGAAGDSGGGYFILRDGQWWLAGVMYAVGDGPDTDGLVNPAGYGDYTYATDAQVYQSQIFAITGTLIPEPGSVLLLATAAAGLLCRRCRA